MRAGFGGQPLPDGAEIPKEQRPCLTHQKDHAGIHDVLGGGPVVNVLARVAVAQGGEGPDGGHERMGGGGDLAADRVEVHERRVRLAGDLLGGVLGNDVELALCEGERGLDVEPFLDPVPVGEDGCDLRRREGGAVEAGIGDVARRHVEGFPGENENRRWSGARARDRCPGGAANRRFARDASLYCRRTARGEHRRWRSCGRAGSPSRPMPRWKRSRHRSISTGGSTGRTSRGP